MAESHHHQHPHAAAALASSSRRSLSLGSSISQSFRQMDTEDPFGRAQTEHEHRDDEENLRWAAMEKLPTYDRMRQGILRRALEDQQHSGGGVEVVDIQKLAGGDGGRELLERLFQDDSERFLRRLRDRIDMVGIELPTIEVRYEQLTVDADVIAAGRALPTLWNAATNFLQLGPGTRDCQTWRRHRLIASSPAARCSACARNWGARLQSVTAGRSLPCSCSEFGRARLQPAVVEVGATGLGAGRAGEGGAAAARRSTMSSTHRFAASSSLPHRWAWPTFATLRPPVANGSWIGSRGMRRGSASGQGRIDYGVTLTHAWEESWAVLLSWTISN